MLGIKFICVGKLKEKFYIDASAEYIKRLAGFCKPEVIEIPEEKLPDNPSQSQIELALQKEGAAIEAKLHSAAVVVALCVEGRQIDSHALSKMLTDCMERGDSRLCFIIGGSHGLSGAIKQRADIKLSMSKMTFPHNLARVILLEQVYRGFMIAQGGKYHK